MKKEVVENSINLNHNLIDAQKDASKNFGFKEHMTQRHFLTKENHILWL